MLVSVDDQKGTVTIYGKTVITVPISHAAKLRPLLSGKIVQYVSEVTPVTGEDVLELLAEMSQDPSIVAPVSKTDADGRLWMYAKGSGYLNIPALKMKFEGPFDFKSLDKLGYDYAEKNPLVQDLMDKNLLGMCGTGEMNRLKSDSAKKQAQRADMSMRNSDGSSIIVDTSGGVIKSQPSRPEGYSNFDPESIAIDSMTETENYSSEEKRLIEEMGWGKAEDDDNPVE